MARFQSVVLAATLFGAAGLSVGCHDDKPHSYGQQRPPVDQLDDRDRGLQSKDVVNASDQMAQSLAALPEVNASPTQLTVVTAPAENLSSNRSVNYDIFLTRLKVNLSKYARGRIALIENRQKLADLQNQELDRPAGGDTFGQGGRPAAAGGPGGIQPDYALYCTITDLPNKGTNYYLFEFKMTNLKTRQLTWTDMYEVRVAR
jgi:Peptidoglycan-synthase activator LpoB